MADDYAELQIRVTAPDGTQRSFKEVREGFEDTAKGAEDAGEAVDDSAESLRRLVRLQMGEQLMRIAVAFRQVADAAGEAFSRIDKNARASAAASRQADQWAKSLRITANEVESLSRIFTMGNVGDDLADVGDVIKEVGVKALEAKRGSEDYILIFRALGVDIDKAMTNATDATFKTIDALSRMENETNALVIADELLSDQGVRLVSYLQSQGKTLTELQAETLKTITVTDEQREGYARLEAANRDLETAEKRLSDTLATATAPAITTVKNALADLLQKILDTNPEFGTFLGLTKEVAKPAFDAGTGLFQMAAAAKLLGINLAKAVPLLGKAGLYGACVALVAIFPTVVNWMRRTGDVAEEEASRWGRAWKKWIYNVYESWRSIPFFGDLLPPSDGSASFGGGGSGGKGGAGRSFGDKPAAPAPIQPVPDPNILPSPSTGGGGGAGPASPQQYEAKKSRVDELQATKASLLSQQRRAQARADLAIIEGNEAEAAATAAQLAKLESMVADAEKQLLGVLKGQELTDLLTEQAERALRRAEDKKRDADRAAAEEAAALAAEAASWRKARDDARAASMKAADDAVSEAKARLDLLTLTGSLDAQEAAVGRLAEAYDQLATTSAKAGDQLGALQAMTEKARLTESGAGKMTIGQELLAGGGVSGIEAVIRKYGGSMADISGTVAGGMMTAYNSPSEIGKAVGAQAGPMLGAAVAEAMSATVERATSAMRAGVQ